MERYLLASSRLQRTGRDGEIWRILSFYRAKSTRHHSYIKHDGSCPIATSDRPGIFRADVANARIRCATIRGSSYTKARWRVQAWKNTSQFARVVQLLRIWCDRQPWIRIWFLWSWALEISPMGQSSDAKCQRILFSTSVDVPEISMVGPPNCEQFPPERQNTTWAPHETEARVSHGTGRKKTRPNRPFSKAREASGMAIAPCCHMDGLINTGSDLRTSLGKCFTSADSRLGKHRNSLARYSLSVDWESCRNEKSDGRGSIVISKQGWHYLDIRQQIMLSSCMHTRISATLSPNSDWIAKSHSSGRSDNLWA